MLFIKNNNVNVDNVGIILPGFSVPNGAYYDLAKCIQEKGNRRGLFVDYYITSEYEDETIDDLIYDIRAKYPDNTKVFMIGHSIGAYLGYEKGIKLCDFFVQIGSVLNSKGALSWKTRSLKSCPKPLITILGDRDGFVKYTLAADEFGDIDDLIENIGWKYVVENNPVVILPKINHMNMANGIYTDASKKIGQKDIFSPISVEKTHKIISDNILDFLEIQRSENTFRIVNRFIYKMMKSRAMVSLYEQVKSPTFMDVISQRLQGIICEDKDVSVTHIHHVCDLNFLYSKPLFYNETVLTHSYMEPRPTRDFFSQYIWFKFKSSESFPKKKSNKKRGCIAQEMNRWIFDQTFNKLSIYQQKNYNEYGKKMLFDSDIIAKPGRNTEWIDTHLHVDNKFDSYVIIKSPVMHTPNEGVPKRFAGMTYVKVISPAQVIDWVTHESFK